MKVFESEDFLIWNKKPGIPVQSRDQKSSLLEQLRSDYSPDLECANRIDQASSGLVCFTKNSRAASIFQKAGAEVLKGYLAIVDKEPEENEILWEDLIQKNSRKRKAFIVVEPEKGKLAKAVYKTIDRSDRYVLLAVKLLTGRFHQIRAQLSKRNIHIKGDIKYGFKRTNPQPGICLHSYALQWDHFYEKIPVTAKLPDYDIWNVFENSIPEEEDFFQLFQF